MNAQEIRNLKWVKLEELEEYENWKLLPRRTINEKSYIENALLDIYLDDVYKQIARKLNISFKDLSTIIKEENSSFYTLKKEIFIRSTSRIGTDDGAWDLLKSYLMIPDVNSVPMIPRTDVKLDVKVLMNYISVLASEERKQLAESLKESEYLGEKSSSEKILEDFKKLSDLEKFQVLNSLKLLQVKIEFPTN